VEELPAGKKILVTCKESGSLTDLRNKAADKERFR
jgi:hypothetical protein